MSRIVAFSFSTSSTADTIQAILAIFTTPVLTTFLQKKKKLFQKKSSTMWNKKKKKICPFSVSEKKGKMKILKSNLSQTILFKKLKINERTKNKKNGNSCVYRLAILLGYRISFLISVHNINGSSETRLILSVTHGESRRACRVIPIFMLPVFDWKIQTTINKRCVLHQRCAVQFIKHFDEKLTRQIA